MSQSWLNLVPINAEPCLNRVDSKIRHTSSEVPSMNYARPQAVLFDLAGRGPSAVRQEALRLLGLPNLPPTWGVIPKRSRKALLRKLACNKGKAAKARLAAVKELLWGLTLEQQAQIEALLEEKRNERRRKRNAVR
jgi:hypothetical protein